MFVRFLHMPEQTAITPTRQEDFPEWYQQVIRAADLAENSEVRGCMVIKPWGYGIWENIQRALDGCSRPPVTRTPTFPLFIPLSYLEKEAAHVEGFAKECAVVTHHRLEAVHGDGQLVPTGELAEPLVIRPTSETIIGAAFARWVEVVPRSADAHQPVGERRALGDATALVPAHRGVPLAGRPHRARDRSRSAGGDDADAPRVREPLPRDHLAIPVIAGEKTESERFPGALQHPLHRGHGAGPQGHSGRHFALSRAEFLEGRRAFKFQSRAATLEYAWTTSWGVSTRLIGTLIMAHADDDGVIVPPRVAPAHAVVIPITPKEETRAAVLEAAEKLATSLRELRYQAIRSASRSIPATSAAA